VFDITVKERDPNKVETPRFPQSFAAHQGFI